MSLPLAHDPGSAAHPDLDPHHALPADTSEPPAKGSLVRKIIVLVIILAIVAIVVWRVRTSGSQTAATGRRAAAAAGNRATPVLTSPVISRTVPVYLTALGTVTAYNTVTLHSRVDGQLLKVNFQEGQTVKEGQLLLQIDPRPYQATVDQAVGNLAKDEANQNNMNAEAQRYTALYQAGVVSKESQQAQISNAGQAGGVIKADQAAIEAAKVNLGYTKIYSPINGVVGLRGVDPGNIVHASDSTGLVVITQIHPIAVIFTLPEDQLPQVQQAIRSGKKLVAEAYDRSSSNKLESGTLLTIDNQIDTTTGTAKLKAVFENKENVLFPNQFVNIRLIISERQNALVVPTAAIQTGTTGNFLFVVHPGAGSGAGAAAGGGGGGRRGGANGGGGRRRGGANAGAPAAGSGAAPVDDGDTTPRTPPAHVNVVNVHVDFAQGSNSILAPGAVNAGDQVVIDGQEKLNDNSPVSPQQAPSGHAAASASGQGVGASSGDSSQPPTSGADTDSASPGQKAGHGHNQQSGAAPNSNGSQTSSNQSAQPGQHQHHHHDTSGVTNGSGGNQ